MIHPNDANKARQISPLPTHLSNGKEHNEYEKLKSNSQLMKLFEEELSQVFWLEKNLLKFLPALISNVQSIALIRVLIEHIHVTNLQIERIAQVFSSLEKKPVARAIGDLENMMQHAIQSVDKCSIGGMRDIMIVSVVQKIEHYEIAAYGTLRQYAETLGQREATFLLAQILEEEKAMDSMLSKVAIEYLNQEAALTSFE